MVHEAYGEEKSVKYQVSQNVPFTQYNLRLEQQVTLMV